MEFPFPKKFKVPSIDPYDRSKDPTDHVETYKTHMSLQRDPYKIMFRVFPVTLAGPTR